MRLIVWTAAIVACLVVVSALSGTGKEAVQKSHGSLDTSCSVKPVVMPAPVTPTSLPQCHSAVRDYMRAIIANVRVTADCWDEFVARNGTRMRNVDKLAESSRELNKLIPKLVKGAEEQLRKTGTLGQCKQHLEAARQLVLLQPELKGEWLPATYKR